MLFKEHAFRLEKIALLWWEVSVIYSPLLLQNNFFIEFRRARHDGICLGKILRDRFSSFGNELVICVAFFDMTL